MKKGKDNEVDLNKDKEKLQISNTFLAITQNHTLTKLIFAQRG